VQTETYGTPAKNRHCNVYSSSKVARRKIKGHLVVLPHHVAQASIVLRWLFSEHRFEARIEDADVVQPGLSWRGCRRRCRIWRLSWCGPHVYIVIAAIVWRGLLVEMRVRIAFAVIEKIGIVLLLYTHTQSIGCTALL